MDKKKVTELIQEVISNNVDSLEFGNDKHNAPLRKANSLLHDALIELGKSDWVSVEDGLPPYGEKVFVTSKMSPDNVFKTEEWKALPSQKMVMTSSSYGKGEWLVSLIGNLLISWRNSYGTT